MPTGTIIVKESDENKGTDNSQSVIYARVSSSDQKQDLDRQASRLAEYAASNGYRVKGVVKETGSGINRRRTKLLSVLRDSSAGVIIVEHKDRLARFGFEYIEALLESSGRRIAAADDGERTDDLVRDMTDVLTSFCARLYGKRSAKNKAKKSDESDRAIAHAAHKTELKPNNKQKTHLSRHAGTARFAYKRGLARRIEEYKKTGTSINAIEQHRQLNALKGTEFPWLYEVSKCAPQEALRDLDRAYRNAFARIKEGAKSPGFPRFKSKKRGKESFRLTGSIHVFDQYSSRRLVLSG